MNLQGNDVKPLMRKRINLHIILFLSWVMTSFNVLSSNTPEVVCITVDENDDLTITWETVDDPEGDFVRYEIERIDDGVVATIPAINQNSFLIAGAGDRHAFYSVIAVYDDGTGEQQFSSAVMANLFLELNNPENGTAVLNWESPLEELTDDFDSLFFIYRRLPGEGWVKIDSVENSITNYRDTITICDGFIDYRVSISTEDCEFMSNVDGENFKDRIVPDIPEIINVTIDSVLQNPVIEWTENSQSDTYGYVIYTLDENDFLVELDTVWGKENTTYAHEIENIDQAYTYSVAAFDSCFTDVTPPTYQTSAKAEVHVSMFLTGNFDVCDRQARLNWTAYEGFSDSTVYEVWLQVNEDVWIKDTTLNRLNHNFPVEFSDVVNVLIKVVDLEEGTTALSNIISVFFNDASPPEYAFIGTATVENEEVAIVFYLGEGGGVQSIELEKYNPKEDAFELIDNTNVLNDEIVFIDENVKVEKQSYSYRVHVMDTCDQMIYRSQIAMTILAELINHPSKDENTIQWSPYSHFEGDLVGYDIYRYFEEDPFATELIGSVTKNDRTYTDDLTSTEQYYEGKVCYYIQAKEMNNPIGIREISRSNTVCNVVQPVIYIPNAFSRNGVNPIFKPETSLHKIEKYDFAIFDRFGRTIFETSDPNEGWDGSIRNGGRAREGVYVYRLSLRDGNGIEVLRNGHVTLIDFSE